MGDVCSNCRSGIGCLCNTEKGDPDVERRWAILEVMGHRRLAGEISEEQVAGKPLLRIDVPGDGDEPVATQLYSPDAIFCLTPCTEEVARREAALVRRTRPTMLALPASVVEDDDDDPIDVPYSYEDEPF